MPITRRHLTGAALALSMPSLSMPSLSMWHIARAARRRVTIGAFDGVFQRNFTDAIIAPFRHAHPDIEIAYYPAANSMQLLSLLRSPTTQPPIDVALLEVTTAKLATDEELLTPLRADALPMLAALPAAFIDGVAGPVAMLDCLAIAYAPRRIVPPPNSWRFLWEKSLAGQIALDPAPDDDAIAFTLVANALFGSDDYRDSLDAGVNAISALAPSVATWYPIPDLFRAITSGAASIGVGWNARGQMLARDARDKLAMAIPVEGSVYQLITVNLARTSQDADAARGFIAELLGADAQRAVGERLFCTPVDPATTLSADAVSRSASAASVRARMMEVDWLQVAAMRDSITRAWQQHITHQD